MVFVDLGEGTNAIGGEKFRLVKETLTDPAQALFRHQGKEQTVMAPLPELLQEPLRTGAFMQEPFQALGDIQHRKPLHRLDVKTGHRQKRNQARDRARAQVLRGSIRSFDDVVVEAVLLIPIQITAVAGQVQGQGELNEVIDKPLRDIGVLGLRAGQLHTDIEQVQA